jgi:hypothetical protein
MKPCTAFYSFCLLILISVPLLASGPNPPEKGSVGKKEAQIARGKYLVSICACNDCHTPKIFTKEGPIPDTTRLLSGHAANDTLPAIPAGVLGPDKWGALTNGHLTGWAGPWGKSFTRNLTPDTATGIGSWTEAIFVKAIRTGKDMGEGRPILPPMPWDMYRNMTDADLKAVFAYLKSLPPIDNAVPDPIGPTGEKLPTMKFKK